VIGYTTKRTKRLTSELIALRKRIDVLVGCGVKFNRAQRKALKDVIEELRVEMVFLAEADKVNPSRFVLKEMMTATATVRTSAPGR
jgi:hypothetical protein